MDLLFVKTKYDTDKSELENKTPDTSGLVKQTDCNTKITEIGNKIPSISELATNSALTTVEDEIRNINNLVKNQIMTQKILKLKKNLLIMIMVSILVPCNLMI